MIYDAIFNYDHSQLCVGRFLATLKQLLGNFWAAYDHAMMVRMRPLEGVILSQAQHEVGHN